MNAADKKEKRTKVFNLSKELNISSETIIEFLKKKGYEVKSHMSIVTDEMLSLVMDHFKKEKEIAERHQRKIQEFRSAKKKTTQEKSEKSRKGEKKQIEAIQEEEAKVVIEETSGDIRTTEDERQQTDELITAQDKIPVSGEIIEEELIAPKQVAQQEEHTETKEEEEITQEIPVQGEKVDQAKTPLETILSRPQRGLTIKGKINLTQAIKEEKEELKEKKKKKKKKLREEIKKQKTPSIYSEDEEEIKTKKRKKIRKAEVDMEEVERAIRETLSDEGDNISVTRAIIRKKKKEKRQEEEQKRLEQLEQEKKTVRVTEFVTVGELANLMRVTAAEVIQKVMSLGIMASINQRLDKDTITLVADEFGFQVEFEDEFTADILIDSLDPEDSLLPRPPVVTVMGHVDHGKTSLLDYIRNTNVVAGEAGGITQHIGAYEVTLKDGKQITFLDTPGHEAFTAMRARGAQMTDLVVLVVAADESVMPQTLEAVSHAQAAGVPIIVAINKIDKPEANPERIKQQLAEHGLLIEEYGGKSQAVEISAKKGTNIDLLLEKILLEAELLNLKANPNRNGRGRIIEAQLDKGRGIVATVLVQKGTLRVGDPFVCGIWCGKIRAMFNERGQRIEVAKPSQPVQVIGFDGIPQAGDEFVVLEDEKQVREVSIKRQQLKREQDFRQRNRLTLDDLSRDIKEGKVRDLPIIVKADVDGSAEALSDALMKLSTEEAKVQVIYKGVGEISESDVLLAMASYAVIVGFHVRPNLKARQLSQKENVDIRNYNIIYDAIDDVRKALEGLLRPTVREEVLATLEVREVFKISKIGTIAGCYVREGRIARNNKVRLIRNGVEIYDGTISSLKRFKDDVKEVEEGFECGIGLDNFNDIKISDVIEAYKLVEIKRKLE